MNLESHRQPLGLFGNFGSHVVFEDQVVYIVSLVWDFIYLLVISDGGYWAGKARVEMVANTEIRLFTGENCSGVFEGQDWGIH